MPCQNRLHPRRAPIRPATGHAAKPPRGAPRRLENTELDALLDEGSGQREGFIQLAGIAAATLGHVRATAALAADRSRGLAHQIAGLEARGQVLGDTGHQHHLVVGHTAEQDHGAAELVLQLVDQRQQALAVQAIDAGGEHLDAADLASGGRQVVAGRAGRLGLELLQLLLQLTVALQQAAELVEQVVAAAAHQLCGFAQLLLGGVHPGQRRSTGDRLDAAHAGGHAAFADDLEQADVTGARDVGTATQLDGEAAAHGQHAHALAVFLTEQRHGTLGLGGLDVGFLDFHRGVATDLGVDHFFQLAQLLRLDRLEVAEVEAQALAVDQRALLLDVLAEDLAQRGMQQVGGRVVLRGGLTDTRLDLGTHAGADAQAATGSNAMVQHGTAGLGGFAHFEAHAGTFQEAAVTDLATGLGIERGLVEDHHALVAFRQAVDGDAVLEQRHNLTAAAGALVAGEAGITLDLDQAVVVQTEGAGRTGTLALGFHLALEAFLVEGQAALAGDVAGQVDREAVGVVELEDHLARTHAAGQAGQILLENAQALLQGLGELLFLGLQHALDMRLLGLELWIGIAHLGDQSGHDPVEEGALAAQLVAVAAGAANDAAQHVATAFVGGGDAVGDQEAAGTDVVGDHLQRRLAFVGAADRCGG